MSDWSVVSEQDNLIQVTLSDGRTITLNRGEEFATPSACEMIDFLQRRDPNIPLRENTSGWLDSLLAAGRADGCVGPNGEINVTPNPGVSNAPPAAPPPTEGDSATSQGAPDVSGGARLNGAGSYVERRVTTNARCEVWNVKEGHTSSVWRMRLEDGTTRQEFAVNVARDRTAGEELERTSETIRRIAESWPEANLAKVLEIAKVRLPNAAGPIVVTRNEWIPDSYEIHRLPEPGTEPGPLVLVERFLTEDSAPSRICRILGRRLNPAECEQVERDLGEFVERTARFAVQVDINDGDLVWNGQRAIAIAIR